MDLQFPNVPNVCNDYRLHTSKTGLRTAVERCLQALSPIADQFDTIYVTGQSGEIPGAVVAWLMGKELRILRKTDENGSTHSHGERIEGPYDEDARYVIIDDFVDRGGTLMRLMKEACGYLVCVCLYGYVRREAEIEAGFAKEIASTEGMNNRTWRLIRQGPNSILFDLGLHYTCSTCPEWWPTFTKPMPILAPSEPIYMAPLGKTRMANLLGTFYGVSCELPSQPSEPLPF